MPGIFRLWRTTSRGVGKSLTFHRVGLERSALRGRAHERGGLRGIERHACPTTGSCGGMYTPTRERLVRVAGALLLGSSTWPIPTPEKAYRAAASALVLVEAVKRSLPLDISHRRSIKTPSP